MRKLALLTICLLLWACDDAENSIYRGHACYFIFDTSLHPIPCQLTAAMGNPGQFLIVSTTMSNGMRHIHTTRNYDHATEDIPLTAQKETNTRCSLGANNAIILGRSSYTNLLMAYEGQCPNCLDNLGGTNHPLAFTANGMQLQCRRCQRSYDVNNGVVAAGEGGHQLYTYNARFDGTLIRAWN